MQILNLSSSKRYWHILLRNMSLRSDAALQDMLWKSSNPEHRKVKIANVSSVLAVAQLHTNSGDTMRHYVRATFNPMFHWGHWADHSKQQSVSVISKHTHSSSICLRPRQIVNNWCYILSHEVVPKHIIESWPQTAVKTGHTAGNAVWFSKEILI